MTSTGVLQRTKVTFLLTLQFLTRVLDPRYFELAYTDTDSLYCSVTVCLRRMTYDT